MLYVFYLLRAPHRLEIERVEALCISLFYQGDFAEIFLFQPFVTPRVIGQHNGGGIVLTGCLYLFMFPFMERYNGKRYMQTYLMWCSHPLPTK